MSLRDIFVYYFHIEAISSICIGLKFDQNGIDRFLRDDIVDVGGATMILIREIKAREVEEAMHSSDSFFSNRRREILYLCR